MHVKHNWTSPNPEWWIEYNARHSAPKNRKKMETGELSPGELLAKCLKEEHWSPFEHAAMSFEITTSMPICVQILRHGKGFGFQQFCVAGDTELYFDQPKAVAEGRRYLSKTTIAEFHRLWHENPLGARNRLQKRHIRVLDETTNQFTHAHVKDVVATGIKPVFEVVLSNGRTIRCTKEHRFYVRDGGWQPLEDAVGLVWWEGRTAAMTQEAFVACNGVPVHQDKEWMATAKASALRERTGVEGIAQQAGISYHTARKWLRIHGLRFTKKETASMYDAWNKGKFGYSTGKRSEETKAKMSASAKRGPDNPLWRGGVKRSWREWVSKEIGKLRKQFLEAANYQCVKCSSSKDLRLHHVIPVYKNPDLALDPTNIEVVCKECHDAIHNTSGDRKNWREKSRGNQLTVDWVKVESIRCVGKEMTYDLEIDHPSHNYVANGIVVHNSQRYSDPLRAGLDFEPMELRFQSVNARQGSSDDPFPDELNVELQTAIAELQEVSRKTYRLLIKAGVAREIAREVLLQGIQTQFTMTGWVRSFITYLRTRLKPSTQREHRRVALQIAAVCARELPLIGEVEGWKAAPVE